MAAAEYYNPNGGGGPVQNPSSIPQFAPPPSRPQSYQQSAHSQQSQPSHLPYPISDAPPPYTPYDVDSRAHSQPPPQNRVRFENENRPPGSILRPSHQSPNLSRPPLQQGYMSNDKLRPPPGSSSANTGGYQPSYGKPVQQPYQQPYFQPPPANLGPQQGYLDPHAYRPAQQPYYPHERSRSRSRSHDRRYSSSTTSRHSHGHHHHRRDEDRDRDRGTKKKSSGVTTFLGAGGGALIGDAIFPGLGTIGGAILGGLGGHEYDKQKREYTRDGRMSRRAHSTAEIPEYYDKDDGRGRRY